MPSRSKPITAVSALSPGAVNKTVFGNLFTSSAKTVAPAMARMTIFQAIPEGCHPLRILRQSLKGSFHGCAKSGNARDILGSRPPAKLLPAAAQYRFQPGDSLGYGQRADALGAANLVRRKGRKVRADRVNIERNFAEHLDRVDMNEAAGLVNDLCGLGDRLDRAGLIVGRHDRDQRRRAVAEQSP